MEKNTDRHLELSAKFIEMGNALMVEGKESKDYTITQTGSFMILMGSLMFDEKDVFLFGQFCSMFSAKKIIENLERDKSPINEFFKNKASAEGTSYEDFIAKINELRKKNGHDPIN